MARPGALRDRFEKDRLALNEAVDELRRTWTGDTAARQIVDKILADPGAVLYSKRVGAWSLPLDDAIATVQMAYARLHALARARD